MSNREVSLYIVDIFIATDKIKRYTSNFTNSDELLHSELEWDATIRELQIIGDATNKILKSGLIDDSFKRIVDFRNQIVHGYFGIDYEIVWEVVTQKIDNLYEELINIVTSNELNFVHAINAAIKENNYNRKIVDFLQNLEKKLNLKNS